MISKIKVVNGELARADGFPITYPAYMYPDAAGALCLWDTPDASIRQEINPPAQSAIQTML